MRLSCDDDVEEEYVPTAEADEEAMQIARSKLLTYWEDVFAQKDGERKDPDDWFVDFEALRPHLLLGQARLRILIAGCGFSRMGCELSKLGHRVVNLDISSTCIEEMKHRFGALGEWVVGDVTNLCQIRDQTFDLVIDKGTSDTLSFRTRFEFFPPTAHHFAFTENSKRHFVGQLMVRSFFAESYRVLAPGGRLLIITTKVKVRGLHADPPPPPRSAPQEVVQVEEPIVGWWKRNEEDAPAGVVVVKTSGNEKCKLKPQRKLRPHRNIEPITNYPFSKFGKTTIHLDGVNIPTEFHERKKVFVHSATK